MRSKIFAFLVAASAFFIGPTIAPATGSASGVAKADIQLEGPGRWMQIAQTVRVTYRVTRCYPYGGCYTTYETRYETRYIWARVFWSETRNSWGYYDSNGYWHYVNYR